MATFYRFIVEQKSQADNGGRKGGESTSNRASKGAAKKGKNVSLFGGDRGGVEHNRKMRAINPLINKATYGVYEKGMRVGRAATGLIKEDKNGNRVVSGVAVTILGQMVLLLLLSWQRREKLKAERENNQNFKQLENGYGSLHGAYEISTNILTGRHTYNQNK